MFEPVFDVDALDLKCPEPVMLLHAAVRDAKPGECIRLTATDPSTKKDVVKFCDFLGHHLQSLVEKNGKLIFLIKKGQAS